MADRPTDDDPVTCPTCASPSRTAIRYPCAGIGVDRWHDRPTEWESHTRPDGRTCGYALSPDLDHCIKCGWQRTPDRTTDIARLTALGDALADAARAITTDPWIDGPNAGPNPKWDALDVALDAWFERDESDLT